MLNAPVPSAQEMNRSLVDRAASQIPKSQASAYQTMLLTLPASTMLYHPCHNRGQIDLAMAKALNEIHRRRRHLPGLA